MTARAASLSTPAWRVRRRRNRRAAPGFFLTGWLPALIAALLVGSPAAADPEYGDPVLPAFDPILTATRDPRLLGADRLHMRDRLLAQGIDPLRAPGLPTLETTLRATIDREIRANLHRSVRVVESNGPLGVETVFEYPEYFLLFPGSEPLPGGFRYIPPRPVDAEEVELFLDDPTLAFERRLAVSSRAARRALLDVRTRKAGGETREGLLNLTIPIKLPRTLERIIGRGEKTSIRLSGREHISLSGESAVSNRFTPTERRTKQSLFPTLDMQQQLQINLAGTIGEKIHLEVDHNSEVIGPDATKIRLSYRGTEDEIIQSIETGDVGLTLPGGQLLGYSSSKSGLFGIKVTGQVGRAEFTLVASKQKAEVAAKSFNSRGGEVTEHIVEAQRYLRNRFFRLDLPPGTIGGRDVPGRPAGQHIDPSSVRVFRFVGNARPSATSVDFVALYVDSTGIWDQAPLFGDPELWVEHGERWEPVEIDLLLDQNGGLVAIDLKREYEDDSVLGVIYDVVDNPRNPTTVYYEVGDDPGQDEGNRQALFLPGDPTPYLRMKLLKPRTYTTRSAYAWDYPLRNIYSLGGSNIDSESFQLRIEFNDPSAAHPDLDTSANLSYLRLFGLDSKNPQGQPGSDNVVDKEDVYLFDLQKGLLKFPLDFPMPFAAEPAQYAAYADTAAFEWEASRLSRPGSRLAEIYDWRVLPSQYYQYNKWKLVAEHAAASGTINLRDTNIEEGSETVTLDGRTLQKGTDYDIDYTFGQVTLKGDAAGRLGPDSQISVTYQYAPFFGGGNSSLLGMNLGYDLGRDSRVSTTWLYERNQIAGHKAKLGETPSRTLVGNLNLQHTFRPYFLTHVANFLSRNDSDKESTLQLNGEVAASLPNPNTRGMVFLEDFEGIDRSDILPISRLSWQWGSAPAQGQDAAFVAATGDFRDFTPELRAQTRWFLPRETIQRRYLNPNLREQEAREPQQVLQLFFDAGAGGWQEATWGGIMRGLGRSGIDLSKAQFLEFWVNDYQLDPGARQGTLHFDFGYLDEDFYWPLQNDVLVTGTDQREDRNRDGIFTIDEDTGLDGVAGGSSAPDYYDVSYGSADDPYPRINGTEANNREDSEDLDGDTVFDRANGYFTIAVGLADSALIDVHRDYPPDRLTNVPADQVWRKYRVRLGDAVNVAPPGGVQPLISQVTHVRIWYDNGAAGAPRKAQLQLSDIKFLGSRWEREGIRKRLTEELLTPAERGAAEAFFIGEVNNKENPDYYPPFAVHEDNFIPEKEQSLVLDYTNLERDHLVRISKFVSPAGEDYTQYSRLSWYVFNPRHEQRDQDLFFRIGGDTLNYYEVSYRFDESPGAKVGWKQLSVDIAELSNAKFAPTDSATGWIATTIQDPLSGDTYRVRVVGRPDLRRVRRYYFGVVNDSRSDPVTGYFYLNDVRLEEVKRENGFAERVALRLNMADVIKVDFDWSKQDAEFHGLNASRGQNFWNEDWNLSSSFRLDDFVPLLGFQLPINVSRRQTIKRPKYLTNSDVELIETDIRNAQSSLDERESYSVRLSHKPSRRPLLRYLVDPWNFSLSGSRTTTSSPLERSHSDNVQGSFSYDLSITGRYLLGGYGPLDQVPLLSQIAVLPRKISFGGNFSGNERTSLTVNQDGSVTPRPTATTRRGGLSAGVEYTPLPIVDLSVNVKSDRDLLRSRHFFGVNIGEENQFTQGVQARFTPPKAAGVGQSALVRPVKLLLQGIGEVRPQLSYNGQFSNNHDPSIRQPGDPPSVHNVSSQGDWDARFSLPIDKWVRGVFPERRVSDDRERQQILERQRRQSRRGRGDAGAVPDPGGARDERPGMVPGVAPGDTAQAPPGSPPGGPGAFSEEDELLTPEERQRREEERLLEAAREQAEREADEARAVPRPSGAPADSSEAGVEPSRRGRLRFPNPARSFLGVMRSASPVQVSYSKRRGSSYGRLRGQESFWYRVGLQSELDLPDSLYAVSALDERTTLSLSTGLKLTRQISTDLKFSKSTSARDQAGLAQQNYQQDWPDLRVAISGLERWKVFGGGGETGWFRQSNLDIGYKWSRLVNGYTATYFNPRTSQTFTPRWNVTFHSGLSASLNGSLGNEVTLNNGTRNEARRLSVSLQLRHSFRAERLLAKLNLYKPGAQPTVNMDVDVTYGKDTNERRLPQANVPDAQTGSSRLSVNPRFSYQITRNLSGAVRFLFSRTKAMETDLVTKTFGLGLEATFVF